MSPLLDRLRATHQPEVAVAVGFAAYAVQAVLNDFRPPSWELFSRWWIPAPLFMVYSFTGMSSAIAAAEMFPWIPHRSWRNAAVASAGLATVAAIASATHGSFVSWRAQIAAFLLGLAVTGLIFSRAKPHLFASPHASRASRIGWLGAFLALVASVDVSLQSSFRQQIKPFDDRYWHQLVLGELYFINVYLALTLLVRASRLRAAVGVGLLVAPHAFRPQFRDYWQLWVWMGPAAALLLAHAMANAHSHKGPRPLDTPRGT